MEVKYIAVCMRTHTHMRILLEHTRLKSSGENASAYSVLTLGSRKCLWVVL